MLSVLAVSSYNSYQYYSLVLST